MFGRIPVGIGRLLFGIGKCHLAFVCHQKISCRVCRSANWQLLRGYGIGITLPIEGEIMRVNGV